MHTTWLQDWLERMGLENSWAVFTTDLIEVAIVLAFALTAYAIVKRILLGVVSRFADRTATHWDNRLIERRLFHRAALFAPAMVIHSLAPAAFQTPAILTWTQKGVQIYMLIVAVLVVDSALNAANDIYKTFDVSRRIPILGYLQVVKLIVSLAAIIVAVSVIIDRSPLLLLSGLGAATAILLLIFKDTILGLVAGVQLVAHDMVRPGDWIEMPKYGADGDVVEITLNTVKVSNWDRTVTTIPTYALITDSFKNWRGMTESGGRRIKRSLAIDVSSIRFCSAELLGELKKIQKLKPYIEEREREIENYNRTSGADPSSPANGRRMTNVGVFREYAKLYLRAHPKVHESLTFLVRQLQPGPEGLPIEVYVFSKDQRWVYYEGIQADIFDHLYAVLPVFELRPFQNPSGWDVSEAGRGLKEALAGKSLQQGGDTPEVRRADG